MCSVCSQTKMFRANWMMIKVSSQRRWKRRRSWILWWIPSIKLIINFEAYFWICNRWTKYRYYCKNNRHTRYTHKNIYFSHLNSLWNMERNSCVNCCFNFHSFPFSKINWPKLLHDAMYVCVWVCVVVFEYFHCGGGHFDWIVCDYYYLFSENALNRE